ncbi:MAG TPA: hypothetical protein VKF36_05460 [Syntrophorhabdales bacterium]|nr:hypothetical protein [Syntrophorhabdales bacterium]
MSFILDALKKAQQRDQQKKVLKIHTAEPAPDSSAWRVKMVSPARYTRFRLEPREDNPSRNAEEKYTEETVAGRIDGSDVPTDAAVPKVPGLPKGAWIAAIALTLLLLIECAVVYDVRARMSAIAADVNKLARQISSTEGRTVKTERDRRNLKAENDTLRQELEAVNADLTSTRKALQTLKVRQQRMTVKKRHPAVTERRSPVPPQAAAPPPLLHGAPPRVQNPSQFDTVEAGSVKAYSIR